MGFNLRFHRRRIKEEDPMLSKTRIQPHTRWRRDGPQDYKIVGKVQLHIIHRPPTWEEGNPELVTHENSNCNTQNMRQPNRQTGCCQQSGSKAKLDLWWLDAQVYKVTKRSSYPNLECTRQLHLRIWLILRQYYFGLLFVSAFRNWHEGYGDNLSNDNAGRCHTNVLHCYSERRS